MILHILNCPPDAGQASAQALAAMAAEDALLLIEDGVYAVLDADWEGLGLGAGRLYALEDDLAARGLGSQAHKRDIDTVSMEGFVSLTARARQVVSWY
ncbi:sulfurtransferase complex subunit TusB [Halomonas piscis]|uniref:Sulfurtransferase complex subunit TusB n=1 Tax=Halomonas piscis TaxID=3031727 RepID=A0ABY9YW96_9GAMM|nr:sulfurtransferase complex subunit TusB [Halomonas piscis]WNK18867.1 sulfurtransferase complex subunit TusB [Halomonas piscis]